MTTTEASLAKIHFRGDRRSPMEMVAALDVASDPALTNDKALTDLLMDAGSIITALAIATEREV